MTKLKTSYRWRGLAKRRCSARRVAPARGALQDPKTLEIQRKIPLQGPRRPHRRAKRKPRDVGFQSRYKSQDTTAAATVIADEFTNAEVPMDAQSDTRATKKRALDTQARSEEADFCTQFKDSLAEVKDVLKQLTKAVASVNTRMAKLKKDVVKIQTDNAKPHIRRLVKSKAASMATPGNKSQLKNSANMKVVLALAIVALFGIVSADPPFSLCGATPEQRHNLVTCVRANVNEATSQKLTQVKERLQCEDLDCVFTKICERSHDERDELKTQVRAALTTCQSSQ
ncbi:hypothetical protein HPB49_003449 [Dermacentor silvarum]|uniref:Uncharacterized protein n=1 Tax=Dermacentor silvarum TaxID=543639 RepID=A0ACB8CUY2_DERSI|nr:hypothetical protein HPB49_003449 [Dermacentor silvarum]